jgi:hypothetical protein
MQQMHQGPPQGGWGANGWKGQDQNSAMPSAYPHPQGYNGDHATNTSLVDNLAPGTAREADDIDEIIRMAEAGIKPPKKGEAPTTAVPAQEAVTTPTAAPLADKIDAAETTEKKTKKEKAVKMVYSDNELSPEERMAMMPRYAFVPDGKTESSLVEAASAPGVTGTVDA